MPHLVTIVLLDEDARLLGALPPFPVEIRWWPSVGEVNRFVREQYNAEVQLLRLLETSSEASDGPATYLGQLQPGAHRSPELTAALSSVTVDLSDDPRRAPFAQPGGPMATLNWAAEALRGLGRGPVDGFEQIRTWNLSAIWRLETVDGPLWIKQVPHFFEHEPAVLRWLASTPDAALFPTLVASGSDGRMLLGHIPGEDLFGASAAVCESIARDLHATQLASAADVPRLLADGVPDRRFAKLLPWIEAVAASRPLDDPRFDALIAGLPERLAAAADCGLPDTLVHGDLHSGNARAVEGGPNVIIDWGDSFVGHPAFDILRITERLPADEAEPIIERWADRWRSDVPGCDPETAVRLLRPVAPLRLAAVYANFLANIEPSEYVYHVDDPANCLASAVKIAAAEETTEPVA